MLETVKAILKEEIEKDPLGKGYVGKTASEIADMLNAPIQTYETSTYKLPTRRVELIQGLIMSGKVINNVSLKQIILDELLLDAYKGKTAIERDKILDVERTETEQIETTHPSRLYDILYGVPYTLNIVTENDIKEVI